MSNEVLWILLLVVNFSILTIFYALFGKAGLYIWTALAVILANIQVIKLIQLFGFTTSMGNVVYSSTFLATDILSENHSKKDAHRTVIMGFAVLIATTLIMFICIKFIPHPDDISQDALALIFNFLPRIAVASVTAYLISQNLDIILFELIRKKFPGDNTAWIRNNGSTMVSQFVDNAIFTLIAFIGVYSWQIIIEVFLVSYVLKIIIAALDTPFLYIAKWIKKNSRVVNF